MNPHVYLNDPKQIEAIESIKRVDEKGYLYHMQANYDYYDIPDAFKTVIDAGCSVFVTKNLEGEILYCRNYDYSHYLHNLKKNPRTGLNMIVEANNPKAKYKSIGVADTYWLDFKNGSLIEGMADDGKTDLSAFILCPYLCMDGMNEKGLAISILALCVKANWIEIDFDTYEDKLDENKENLFLESIDDIPDPYWPYSSVGSLAVNKASKKAWIAEKELICTTKENQPNYLHPIAMRMVLDNCANIKEALAFLDGINVKAAMPGADYHVMLADTTGESVLVEWIDNKMITTSINHATNYYVAKQDKHWPENCGRDEVLKAGLYRTAKAGMSEQYAENLLKLVIQDPNNKTDRGKTQYTCIYNLNKKTVKVFSFGDMSKAYEYELKKT